MVPEIPARKSRVRFTGGKRLPPLPQRGHCTADDRQVTSRVVACSRLWRNDRDFRYSCGGMSPISDFNASSIALMVFRIPSRSAKSSPPYCAHLAAYWSTALRGVSYREYRKGPGQYKAPVRGSIWLAVRAGCARPRAVAASSSDAGRGSISPARCVRPMLHIAQNVCTLRTSFCNALLWAWVALTAAVLAARSCCPAARRLAPRLAGQPRGQSAPLQPRRRRHLRGMPERPAGKRHSHRKVRSSGRRQPYPARALLPGPDTSHRAAHVAAELPRFHNWLAEPPAAR